MLAPRRARARAGLRLPIALALVLLGLQLTQACERPLDGRACTCEGAQCGCLPGWQCCAGNVCHRSCDAVSSNCEPVTADDQTGQWCWMSPQPHGRILFDIWGAGQNDLWAAGEGGTLLHRQAESWKLLRSPTDDAIRQVWGIEQDRWLVTGPSLFRLRGDAWLPEPDRSSNLGSDFQHVWGSAADDVWAVTDSTVLRPVAGEWSSIGFPSEVSGLKTIWGSDPEHVWAVGKQIYRWDGSAWTRVYDNAGCMKKGVSWTDIQGRGSDDVWVTNYVECTVHWDGHEWQQAPDGQKLRRLFAIRDSGDVGALQSDGQLINWDGSSWHAIRQLDDS